MVNWLFVHFLLLYLKPCLSAICCLCRPCFYNVEQSCPSGSSSQGLRAPFWLLWHLLPDPAPEGRIRSGGAAQRSAAYSAREPQPGALMWQCSMGAWARQLKVRWDTMYSAGWWHPPVHAVRGRSACIQAACSRGVGMYPVQHATSPSWTVLMQNIPIAGCTAIMPHWSCYFMRWLKRTFPASTYWVNLRMRLAWSNKFWHMLRWSRVREALAGRQHGEGGRSAYQPGPAPTWLSVL